MERKENRQARRADRVVITDEAVRVFDASGRLRVLLSSIPPDEYKAPEREYPDRE